MIGGKANASMAPTALGSLLGASTYGQTIPQGYGLMKSPMLAIWAANIRQGPPPGQKKFKAKKKGTLVYIENIDFLIGTNPILGVCQFWENATKLALNYVEQTSNVGFYGSNTVTISDPYFYAVIAVTVNTAYSYSFNDYGAPSPSSGSGTFETPLWNTAWAGPDPTSPSFDRYWPYLYTWTPAMGAEVVIPYACGATYGAGGIGAPFVVNIYYAQLSKVLRYEAPAAYLRLTFEPTLADGPEYAGTFSGTNTLLSTQQVLMPPFAGLGSEDYDLGSSGAIPDVRPEVQFPFTVYSNGDADFPDMIEDIVKSGIAQVSPSDTSATLNSQPVQHGASAYNLPGAVQKKLSYGGISTIGATDDLIFDRANVAGNILLGFWSSSGGTGVPTVNSSNGDDWNTIDALHIAPSPDNSSVIAYAPSAGADAGNQVNFVPVADGTGIFMGIAELVGVDTFDTSVATPLTPGQKTNIISLTTGNAVGQPAIVFAFSINIGTPVVQPDPTWNDFWGTYLAGNNYVQYKIVWAPTTVTLNNVITGQVGDVSRLVLASFKLVAPSTYPRAFGNFIDKTSMDICRLQARAYGLHGALSMLTQKACRDWMGDLYSSMNAAPFYSGNLLKQMPYGEVSAAANGAIYTAPTASGPIANLSILSGGAYGDFLGDEKTPPVTISRTAQFDAPNILQYQIPNRSSDYNPVAVSQPEPGSLSLYGVRKAAPETHDEIADADVARIILGIKCRRQAYIRNTAKFKLGPKGILYEPMDLVTLTEPSISLSNYAVRFTSVSVNADWSVDCEAEPYIYGVHGPTPVVANGVAPNVPSFTADPGNVNTPIIFEPVPRLYGSQNQAQLWCVVSSSSLNYGGCYVYLSTDGGSSYNQVGAIASNGVTGYSVGDWPAANDPDTANNISLDLTESLGILVSYTATDRDNFTYPCYVAGGGGGSVGGWANGEVPSGSGTAFTLANTPTGLLILFRNEAPLKQGTDFTITGVNITLTTTIGSDTLLAFYSYGTSTSPSGIPYELTTYNSETMTAANKYTLNATGSGDELRRAVYGAPDVGAGVDHPNNSRFAFLGNPAQPNPPGILKLTMDPTWIGVTLYFKFLPFNTFGNTVESLSDVVAYSYTPTGIPGGGIATNQSNYVQTPAVALSQPSGTTIDMAQVSVQFSSNTVNYNARTFTITNPSVPTTYYATIADPSYVGDTGALTDLVATCSTSDALVGVPGNTFVGFIVCVPGGGASAIAAPGGWPQPQSAVVVS